MALTKDFKLTVMQRAKSDKAFRNALLTESINELFNGDLNVGKAILRDYINSTVSFEKLSTSLAKSQKSLMRMLSNSGNPTTESLFAIFQAIQKINHVKIHVDCN